MPVTGIGDYAVVISGGPISSADVYGTGREYGVSDGIDTAVLLSLFTDKRLTDAEARAYGLGVYDYRGGWWGSEFSAYEIGSYLWLSTREKDKSQLPAKAREWCLDSLEWMKQEGIAKDVLADVQSIAESLQIKITIIGFAENARSYQYFYNWQNRSAVQ